MNPMLKTALIALVVVIVYDKFLKEQIAKLTGAGAGA
jgi:hypothetical protein